MRVPPEIYICHVTDDPVTQTDHRSSALRVMSRVIDSSLTSRDGARPRQGLSDRCCAPSNDDRGYGPPLLWS